METCFCTLLCLFFFQSSVFFFSPNCFSIHYFSFLFYRYYPAGYDVTVVDNLINANMESLERVKKIANCDSSRIRFGDKKKFPLYLCVILFISLFLLLSLSLSLSLSHTLFLCHRFSLSLSLSLSLLHTHTHSSTLFLFLLCLSLCLHLHLFLTVLIFSFLDSIMLISVSRRTLNLYSLLLRNSMLAFISQVCCSVILKPVL